MIRSQQSYVGTSQVHDFLSVKKKGLTADVDRVYWQQVTNGHRRSRACGLFLFVTDHEPDKAPVVPQPAKQSGSIFWRRRFAHCVLQWGVISNPRSGGALGSRPCGGRTSPRLADHPRGRGRAAGKRKHDPQRHWFRPAAGLPLRCPGRQHPNRQGRPGRLHGLVRHGRPACRSSRWSGRWWPVQESRRRPTACAVSFVTSSPPAPTFLLPIRSTPSKRG